MQEEHSRHCDISALVQLLELRNRIGFIYGSEDISMLFYSLIRREQPLNVVELGTGLGVSALWMAQAVKEVGKGHVWTIDDGSQWQDNTVFRKSIAPLMTSEHFNLIDDEDLDYPTFVNRLTSLLALENHMTFLHDRVDMESEEAFTAARYPFLEKPIDLVFLDINRKPSDILDVLYFLLPHMSEFASIFVDSASTSLTSYLFLENLITQLNHSKVPRRFLIGKSPETRQKLTDIVSQRRFTLVHLIEKVKRAQNSTAWIKIEANDYVPHPQALMKWV